MIDRKKTHVNIIAIKLPYSEQKLEYNDNTHLNKPWKHPSSCLNLNRKIYKARRYDKHQKE